MSLSTVPSNTPTEKFLPPEPSGFRSVSLEVLHPNTRMPQSGIIATEHCHLPVGLLLH